MAKFGDVIDGLIEPFAPAVARRRMAERAAIEAIRQYNAAATDRRTQGWRRPGSSADREVRGALPRLRNGARELVRNNKYAASAARQIVANMVGDGITATMQHTDTTVRQKAQDDWDGWAESKVDGEMDFYGVQKLTARSIIEGGETLLAWGPDDAGPDGRVRGMEGDWLDHQKEDLRIGAGRIVQGVEFDGNGDRSAYWLFPTHPGDIGGYGGGAQRYVAANVDHVFERLRWGQTRGVSWFAPVAIDLRDIGDVEDAVLMKKKVEACVSLILTPAEGATGSPLAGKETSGDPKRADIETLRPGMIFRARPGETASTLNPSSTSDGVEYLKHELMGVCANLAPYHLVTGDSSQSNYTSMRSALLGFWANLDDWQQNMMVPDCCKPAVGRRMRRLAAATGDRRFLQVKTTFAMPPRRLLDPLKDLAGEEAEIRAGLKSMVKALAERGIDWRKHLQEIADVNTLIDSLGLALDTDPRRVNDQGALQLAAGYLAPKTGQNSGSRLAKLLVEALQAEANN